MVCLPFQSWIAWKNAASEAHSPPFRQLVYPVVSAIRIPIFTGLNPHVRDQFHENSMNQHSPSMNPSFGTSIHVYIYSYIIYIFIYHIYIILYYIYAVNHSTMGKSWWLSLKMKRLKQVESCLTARGFPVLDWGMVYDLAFPQYRLSLIPPFWLANYIMWVKQE